MNENNISQASLNTNTFSSNPAPASTSIPDSPKSRKALFACIGGLVGLIVGGAGVFGLTQLFQKPAAPATCDCPKCPATTSQTGLDFDFLKLESSNENIIYSPLSIKNGLALLSAGAAGDTATEINNVLGDAEIPTYNNIADTLSLANAVFIRDTFSDKVLSTYVSTVEDNYGAEVIYDNFTSSANMDNWVSQKTFGLIDKIGIQPDNNLEMVLTNALAIQMDWQYPFDSEDTRGKTFYQADDTEITATTMKKETSVAEISYYTDDNATMLAMPLEPTDEAALEFIAIMPESDLGNYIENFNLSTLESMLTNSISADTPKDGVEIYIPKFKFDYTLDFKKDLSALGIAQAFDKDLANFSNMASSPLYVSDAVHKANIDFSEDGIKAAAVTAFAMTENAVALEEEPQPVIIDIDRPFLFLIRDKNNGVIWFAGAVYQPNLWADDASEYYR